MPALLDVLAVPMLKPQPHEYQSENHLIDDKFYWSRQGVATWDSLKEAVEDPGGPLWTNDSSSAYGENDRVADEEAAKLTRSLYLVRPKGLTVVVVLEGGGCSRRSDACVLGSR